MNINTPTKGLFATEWEEKSTGTSIIALSIPTGAAYSDGLLSNAIPITLLVATCLNQGDAMLAHPGSYFESNSTSPLHPCGGGVERNRPISSIYNELAFLSLGSSARTFSNPA